MRALTTFLKNEDGPTSVEYAVMLALILMSCVVTIRALGSTSGGMWANNQQRLNEAGFGN